MSHIEAATALLTAINFDRFDEIEARHAPHATFQSFRGPTLRDSFAIADWHRQFLREYADCNYTDVEAIEQGDTVVMRATIEAKGYDWRQFTQRVVEVMRFEEGLVVERRLYGMFRDVAFDKPATAAMDNALGYKGGSPAATKQVVEKSYEALESGEEDSIKETIQDKVVLVDGVYGLANGLEGAIDLMRTRPRPAFGTLRVVGAYYGEHNALIEEAIDPARARQAAWLRLVDDKILVIELYWMLREIGVNPYENYARDRHQRQVILPI